MGVIGSGNRVHSEETEASFNELSIMSAGLAEEETWNLLKAAVIHNFECKAEADFHKIEPTKKRIPKDTDSLTGPEFVISTVSRGVCSTTNFHCILPA